MQASDPTSPGNPGALVSIIVPSYNHGRYVRAALVSAIEQDYPNIELIVIDDGSSDDSIARIREMADRCTARFVRFEIRARANRGLCETLNEGIAWAQGEYLSVLDSDDILLPRKTSVLVSQLAGHEKRAGVFGGCTLIDEQGAAIGSLLPAERSYAFADILGRDKALISSCMLVRLDAVRRVGGYKAGLYIEDWYMWLKLTEAGNVLHVIPEPLVQYRQHGTNISKNVRMMFNARREILALYGSQRAAKKALSIIWLELAVELSRTAKADALNCVLQALHNYPDVAASRFLWTTLLRVLAPVPVLDSLSQARKAARGRSARKRADA